VNERFIRAINEMEFLQLKAIFLFVCVCLLLSDADAKNEFIFAAFIV
jgi:hypothetical protein